jgi:hypothetical protein
LNQPTKFEFCSAEWVGYARAYIQERAKDADLTGLNVSFNEVFTDPPARLDPEGAGTVGWYVRTVNGHVEVSSGVLSTADLKLTVDYETVLPAARKLSTDPPLDEGTQQALTDGITREGDESAMKDVTFMAGIHDFMAVRTQ